MFDWLYGFGYAGLCKSSIGDYCSITHSRLFQVNTWKQVKVLTQESTQEETVLPTEMFYEKIVLLNVDNEFSANFFYMLEFKLNRSPLSTFLCLKLHNQVNAIVVYT